MKDAFLRKVLTSPFVIWGIPTERNREDVGTRRKLRIWMTRNVGG